MAVVLDGLAIRRDQLFARHMIENQGQFQYPLEANRQLEECRIEKPLLVAEVGAAQGRQAIA